MTEIGDQKSSRIGGLLSAVFAPELVTGWSVVVEAIGEDGKSAIWTLHSSGSNSWNILGRLAWASEYLKATELTDAEEES